MTKDSNIFELKYRSFIFNTLLELGFSPSCKGTYYLTNMIILAINYNDFIDIDINLKELVELLSKNIHYSSKNIQYNIEYAIKSIDKNKTEKNFKSIFNIDYDTYFISLKSIIGLILTLIYNSKLEISKKEC